MGKKKNFICHDCVLTQWSWQKTTIIPQDPLNRQGLTAADPSLAHNKKTPLLVSIAIYSSVSVSESQIHLRNIN
ncbi:hypothetical protein [Paenibacillus ihuae]|uniref:hypothetical protein n=1 Tax=Paenibacillus ihuae TaxID=1232431 RepID=UPI001AE0CF73|nr:hypothetical protein [Paenibacillus ihuae]